MAAPRIPSPFRHHIHNQGFQSFSSLIDSRLPIAIFSRFRLVFAISESPPSIIDHQRSSLRLDSILEYPSRFLKLQPRSFDLSSNSYCDSGECMVFDFQARVLSFHGGYPSSSPLTGSTVHQFDLHRFFNGVIFFSDHCNMNFIGVIDFSDSQLHRSHLLLRLKSLPGVHRRFRSILSLLGSFRKGFLDSSSFSASSLLHTDSWFVHQPSAIVVQPEIVYDHTVSQVVEVTIFKTECSFLMTEIHQFVKLWFGLWNHFLVWPIVLILVFDPGGFWLCSQDVCEKFLENFFMKVQFDIRGVFCCSQVGYDNATGIHDVYVIVPALSTPDDNRVVTLEVYVYARKSSEIGIVEAIVDLLHPGLSSPDLVFTCITFKNIVVDDELCNFITVTCGIDAVLRYMNDSGAQGNKVVITDCCTLFFA